MPQVFDSTERKRGAVQYLVSSLVEGLAEGLAGEQEGAAVRVTVPAHLAYGRRGLGPVPPHCALTFDVEVIKVEERDPEAEREMTVSEAAAEYATAAEGGEETADEIFRREAAAAAETMSRLGLPSSPALGAPRRD